MDTNIILLVLSIGMTLFLMKRNYNIGLIMLLNCIFIILATGMDIPTGLESVRNGLLGKKTINLILLLTLIMMIENIMRKTGMIKQMTSSLNILIKNSFFGAVMMPVVLGLLPSPGGARFSCPMVEEIIGDKLSSENKAFLNYWFRHVWMDGFILYPGIIILSELTNITVTTIFLHMLPFMIITFISGAIIVKNKISSTDSDTTKGNNPNINASSNGNTSSILTLTQNKKLAAKDFLIAFLPILIIISFYMVLQKITYMNITTYSLFISGFITIFYLIIYNSYSFKNTLETLKESFNPRYLLIVVGVMIFNEFLSSSGLTTIFVSTIAYYNIPKELMFILLPFCTALLSGITVSYVSVSIPLLIPLGITNNIWYISLAYTAGFIGLMITPLHLCCTMTCDFFKVNMSTVLGKVLISLALLIILSSLFLLLMLKVS